MVKDRKRELVDDLIFIGPGTIFFVVIVGVSFFLGIYYAFTEWNGVSQKAVWVGLENFRTIFSEDPRAGTSAWFTVRFTLTSVILSNVVGLALAMIVTQPMKLANTYRAIFFLPNVIGGIILGFIWRFIFSSGMPAIGELIPLEFFQLPWLGDPFTGFWATVIVFTWKTTGYLMVVYIAAIISIDDHLLESARIDGASQWQMFVNIVLPLITPAITICLFLMLSWATKIFDVIFSLTKGGPFNSTEAFALNIYYEAFQFNNYGLGAAKAILFFIVVGAFTLAQVSFTKRLEIEA
ncbi:MAG: sugar ABC transporter permease [Spirochaeta sp.]|jgi:raffinose/stachyose/melibiose transport system permease protein|nr:sugar ABC transporter permease [Spirochaeta sp.]